MLTDWSRAYRPGGTWGNLWFTRYSRPGRDGKSCAGAANPWPEMSEGEAALPI